MTFKCKGAVARQKRLKREAAREEKAKQQIPPTVNYMDVLWAVKQVCKLSMRNAEAPSINDLFPGYPDTPQYKKELTKQLLAEIKLQGFKFLDS